MRTSDADIFMVPGWNGSGPDHWQSRWERNLRTARRVEQEDWSSPDKDLWVGNIIKAVASSARPALLVGHSRPTARQKLGFPSVLVASADDPYCSAERSRQFAADWGAHLIEIGPAGHINAASGHGPWPDGVLRFGAFLKRLG
jgi:uncharacterized protein